MCSQKPLTPRKRNIFVFYFLRGGQSNFFFSSLMPFPYRNFNFDRPKNISMLSKSYQKKKKSSLLCLFSWFPPSIFNFPPFLLQFSFSSPFFFSCLFFPAQSAEALCSSPPLPSPACYVIAQKADTLQINCNQLNENYVMA